MRQPGACVVARLALSVAAVASARAWAHSHDATMQGDPRADVAHGREPSAHVAPAPPTHPMPPMSADAMIDAMAMDDDATFAKLRFDRLERGFGSDAPTLAWDFDAWIGHDLDKLRIRSEGEHLRGGTEAADVEALWSHAIAAFWDSEIGFRHDVASESDRTWLAIGVQGLAPYWFEIGAIAYVADGGRAAIRVETDYDLALTQRWILQPRAEIDAYAQRDRAAGIGAGLSDLAAGLRLRYEIRREFAPYVGVEWSRRFGGTAGFARAKGLDVDDVRWLVGVRVWY